jgi:hypothetical protein
VRSLDIWKKREFKEEKEIHLILIPKDLEHSLWLRLCFSTQSHGCRAACLH